MAIPPAIPHRWRQPPQTGPLVLNVGRCRQLLQIPPERLDSLLTQGRGQRRQGTAISIGVHQMNCSRTKALTHGGILQPLPDRTTPHRRQLRRITDQQQPARIRQRLQQGAHQLQIHHRHLINHQQIQLQRSLTMATEPIPGGLQPAMQRETGQLVQPRPNGIPQPTRCFTGGCRQPNAQCGMALARPPHQLHHRAGLARARAATEQHHGGTIHGQHRSLLLGIERARGLWGHLRGRQGWRLSLQQLLHHPLHGFQPAPPADPLAPLQQRRVVPLQPATGLNHRNPVRRERQIQLTPLQRIHQGLAELSQSSSPFSRRTAAHQSSVDRCGKGRRPAAAHTATCCSIRSRARTRCNGAGSTMRPGPVSPELPML